MPLWLPPCSLDAAPPPRVDKWSTPAPCSPLSLSPAPPPNPNPNFSATELPVHLRPPHLPVNFGRPGASQLRHSLRLELLSLPTGGIEPGGSLPRACRSPPCCRQPASDLAVCIFTLMVSRCLTPSSPPSPYLSGPRSHRSPPPAVAAMVAGVIPVTIWSSSAAPRAPLLLL